MSPFHISPIDIIKKAILISIFAFNFYPLFTFAQETDAEEILRSRDVELRKEIINVAPNVYTAVGYSPANVSMIVGANGLIIIDTGMNVSHAEEIVNGFREISDLPVRGIIYTHAHGDHTGGAAAFIGDDLPEIWALGNFGIEDRPLSLAGLTIQRQRGVRQAGFALPDELRINNGIAPAIQPGRADAFVANLENTAPNKTFASGREIVEIAGVELELVAAPGETNDQIYVWYPTQEVLFAGDNYYKSFPNLYAIRGTPYRNVLAWSNSLTLMLDEQPAVVIPGHTRPVIGEEAAQMALTRHRDAVLFVHDKTIEGMNLGLMPDQLVEYVQLPDELADDADLGEYYGRVDWAVRSIFTGYLGWYDGNPTNLSPLYPSEEGIRIAELAGGIDELREKAIEALDEGDAQWAAQLADYLLAINSGDGRAKIIKADALTSLARQSVNALARNYYLTIADILRQE